MIRLNNLSEDFLNKVIEKAAGKVSQKLLEDFIILLENEIQQHYFTNTSESNLLRIIQNQFEIKFFIDECLKYPHQIEILFTIANNSNYLSDILVRNPEYFWWIVNPSTLNQKTDFKFYLGLLDTSLTALKSFDSKANTLRNFKRKEILRIGLKDLFLNNDLDTITKSLSHLAIAISSKLFQLSYQEILNKYKIEKVKNKYVLLALGKLGGNELNYSSDIDLMVFYDKNTLISNKIYYHQILNETILLFIETASKKTGSGFLYRVDFRLRPDGRNAPLCGSYNEYLRYYETRGEDWERQMLIKANYLSGSKILYNRFFKYLNKFIYPSSFFIHPAEQIKKLKSSIEKQNNTEGNIKLSSGGIRDIEFAIQTLQLINGAKDSSIQTGNTLNAIKKLRSKSLLTKKESINLSNAYEFYRKIEHYLQLMNDQQTHKIPEEGEIAEKTAHFLDFNDFNSFKLFVSKQQETVQNIFSSIMNSGYEIVSADFFNKLNFTDKNRAQNNLEFLRTGISVTKKKQFDKRTSDAFEKIEDQLFNFLIHSIDPDLVLENFSRIIKFANFPKIWYDEFKDQKFFELFLKICERSQKTVDLFAEDKMLRDDFLSRQALIPLENTLNDNLDYKSFLFRSSLQLVSKNLLTESFLLLYSDYLTNTFIKTFNEFSFDREWKKDFFIAAMGSFGTEQLNFSSDIDLIFVVRDINSYPNIQKDFQTLLLNLKNIFPLLEIDCRLRPEGKSSLLVWDIKAYKNYFSNRARTWEIQAFTKCRFLYGNKVLFQEFIDHYLKIVDERNKSQIKNEIIEMRKKLLPINVENFNIKKSYGGLIDVDFILTFLLINNSSFFNLIRDRNIYKKEVFSTIIKSQKVTYNLLTHYNFLKKIELTLQNIFNIKIAKVPGEKNKLKKLSTELGYENEITFNQRLNDTITEIKKAYQTIFKL